MSMKRQRVGKSACALVMIEWEDSVQPRSSWQLLAELEDPTVILCRSVGWLIRDTPTVKVLAPNFGCVNDSANLQVSGQITIPARAVVRMVRLKEPAL